MTQEIHTANTRIIIEAADQESPFDMRPLWQYRELLAFMVWRDVTVRYKQTALGIGWVVLQPVVTLVLFSVVFGVLLKVDTEGDVPYPLYLFTALLPWRYFSSALGRGGGSLLANTALVSKVYFPRLIIPLASVITPIVDFAISFVLLLVMMIAYGYSPFTFRILLLPVLILLSMLTALGVSLWLAALNVRYRDVTQIIPFLTQSWMYITPVVYAISLVPEKWRPLYSLNPMVGVTEGFRWALLDAGTPDFAVMGISIAVALIILLGGLIFFKRMEHTFGDEI